MSLALVWHHVIVSLRAAAAKLLALLMPIFAKQRPVVCYWYEEIRTGWILQAHIYAEGVQSARVFGGNSEPFFFRASATYKESHLQSNLLSLTSNKSAGTCFSGSLTKFSFRPLRQLSKFPTAHFVLILGNTFRCKRFLLSIAYERPPSISDCHCFVNFIPSNGKSLSFLRWRWLDMSGLLVFCIISPALRRQVKALTASGATLSFSKS